MSRRTERLRAARSPYSTVPEEQTLRLVRAMIGRRTPRELAEEQAKRNARPLGNVEVRRS